MEGAKLGKLLQTNVYVKIGELLLLFIVAYSIIKLIEPIVKDNLLLKQGSVWLANIGMLIMVWLGLRLRGKGWKDFGLTCKSITFKKAGRTFLLSLMVFVFAMVGFVLGSIIMANITGIPE